MKVALLLLLSLTCAVNSRAQSDSSRRAPGGDSLRHAVDSEVIFRGRDRQRANSIRVNGVELVDPLTGRIGPSDIHSYYGSLPFSDSSRLRQIWMPRDSNDIWKHDGPDTGLIQLVTQPWGYYTGRLVSHDPNWVVIVAENGLKQEIQTSKVKGVMDLKVVVDTTNTTRLRVRNVDGVWSRPHLLAYFVPTILAGVTEPTASGGSGFFGLLFAMMGFRIPHVLYNYMGEFFGVSYESRSFRTTPTSLEDDYWNVRYVALTPGLSYRGLVSIGVTIGVPVTASLTTFDSGKSFGEGQALRSSMFNPLIEPRIILAWPLLRGPSDGGLLLLAEAGYPLGTAFNGLPPVSIGSSITRPNLANSVRLPEISLGLSYVLSLHYQPDHVQME